MSGIKTEVTDRDIWVNGFEFAQGDDGADAVVPSGIEKTDMHRQVDAGLGIMGTEHVKCMTKVESTQLAVPAPVGIRVREMTAAGAV